MTRWDLMLKAASSAGLNEASYSMRVSKIKAALDDEVAESVKLTAEAEERCAKLKRFTATTVQEILQGLHGEDRACVAAYIDASAEQVQHEARMKEIAAGNKLLEAQIVQVNKDIAKVTLEMHKMKRDSMDASGVHASGEAEAEDALV